jgi:AraC-like DNA-binding protein
MPYREIAPLPALAEWVECFWTHRDDGTSGVHRVLPDGCVDLVFDLAAGEGMAVGTMTRPLLVPPRDGGSFLGVRFRPGRAAAFLRIPLADITNASLPLRELWKADLAGPIAEDPTRAIDVLQRELLRRLGASCDRRVIEAIDRILASGGAARIDALSLDLGVSRQHLARQFLHHVGVPPKTFARVARFRRLVSSLDAGANWAGLAIEHGYYDQSHLISEFRELAGTTPAAFHFSNR